MRLIGIDIDASIPGQVKVSMEEYAATIKKINVFRSSNPKEPLNEVEVKILRGYVGKLLWLSGNVRPDLSFHALDLSTSIKDADMKSLKKVN